METIDKVAEAAYIAGVSGGLGLAGGAFGYILARPALSRKECAITATVLAPFASAMIADGTFGTNPYNALAWIASATALAIGAYIGTSITDRECRTRNTVETSEKVQSR